MILCPHRGTPGKRKEAFQDGFKKVAPWGGDLGHHGDAEAAREVLPKTAFCFPSLDSDKDCSPVC